MKIGGKYHDIQVNVEWAGMLCLKHSNSFHNSQLNFIVPFIILYYINWFVKYKFLISSEGLFTSAFDAARPAIAVVFYCHTRDSLRLLANILDSPRLMGSNVLNHLVESTVESSRKATKAELASKFVYDDPSVFRRLSRVCASMKSMTISSQCAHPP